ncbi:MAG: hypothetical protein M0024_07050 [Nitrospiraceae bacterium]|nr:hypothetical protein [Nitrospiraceae bacterium]
MSIEVTVRLTLEEIANCIRKLDKADRETLALLLSGKGEKPVPKPAREMASKRSMELPKQAKELVKQPKTPAKKAKDAKPKKVNLLSREEILRSVS